MEHELLAVIAEQVNTLVLLTLRVNAKKGTQMPKPLKILRPWETDKTPRVSMGDMARQMSKG